MGFWHTGYMDFHEPTEEIRTFSEARSPTFPCPTCGVEFSSERDLRVHTFEGHPTLRPLLVFEGRECGRSRLTITSMTSPSDWVIRNADAVWINGISSSITDAVELLSTRPRGVVDVTLANGVVRHDLQFEFALAEAPDLDGVDAALERLIDGGELSHRAIYDFIKRSEPYPTASKYRSGLANYLYGVLAREGSAESGITDTSREGSGYEARYDQAVKVLGTFDRAPAEAICGIVAFHYNQFDRAMTRTKSQRVAEVSMRFEAMLNAKSWSTRDLAAAPHPSLDFALSDSVAEEVLAWCALPFDGTAKSGDIAEMAAKIESQRAYDALKLHLVAAEHYLVAGNLRSAAQHAERLRHGRTTEGWYSDFRHRLQGVWQQ
jgi:hypothetical protein